MNNHGQTNRDDYPEAIVGHGVITYWDQEPTPSTDPEDVDVILYTARVKLPEGEVYILASRTHSKRTGRSVSYKGKPAFKVGDRVEVHRSFVAFGFTEDLLVTP